MKKTNSSVPGASLLLIGVILSLSFGCSQEQFKLHESLIKKENQAESDKATKNRVIEESGADIKECLDTTVDTSGESILPEESNEQEQNLVSEEIEPRVEEKPRVLLPEVTLGDEELAYLEEQERKKDIEQARHEPEFPSLEARIREVQELIRKRDTEGVLYKLTFFTEDEKQKMMSLRSNEGGSLLHFVVDASVEGRAEGLADDPRVIEALCPYTAVDDLNTNGFTALHIALLDSKRNYEMAKALLRCGASANVPAQPPRVDGQNSSFAEIQPIQLMVASLRSDVFEVAFKEGADLKVTFGPVRMTLLGVLEQARKTAGEAFTEEYEKIKSILTSEGVTKLMKADFFTSENSIVLKSEKFSTLSFDKGWVDIKAISDKLQASDEEIKMLQEKVFGSAMKTCKDAGFEVCEVADAKLITQDTGTIRSAPDQKTSWIEKSLRARLTVVGRFAD